MNWLNSAIIYQIFIDRFAGCTTDKNSNAFLGGNLVAATSKLKSIADLGFNTIWLSPYYSCSAYHGYHITNFNEVDPHFGTYADLVAFIDKAHSLNIKVIADFVPNHCSSEHPYFVDACKNAASKYRDWFIFDRWPTAYRCFLNYSELPKFNMNNIDVQEHLLSSARKWINAGFDGLRVDHAIGISFSFLQKLRIEVKQAKPDAVIIGEVWAEGIATSQFNTLEIKRKEFRQQYGIVQEDLQLDYDGVFDGVFDFHLRNLLIEFAHSTTIKEKEQLTKRITQHLSLYSDSYCAIGFLDNHDTDRFLFVCQNNIQCFEQATNLLFSLPIPICIYNGTERGMSQKLALNAKTAYSDLQVRQPIEWNLSNPILEYFKVKLKEKTWPF